MSGEHHDIAIVGSGFSGLGMAIALRREGLNDFVVLERADSVGGTWRDNHYPGCACDVPTPLYSFSFAPNPEWSRMFAPHAEIRAYLEDCTDRYDVRRHLRFGADLLAADWDERAQRWQLELAGGRRLTARVLISGPGGLSQPGYPEIEGLPDFAGPVFHSADWNHDVDLAGKRVAVIGTGASAIQLIPRVARAAAHVDVFQRTPPWVLPKLDRPIGRAERWLYRRVPITQRALRAAIFTITEAIGLAITRRPRLLWGLEAIGRLHLRRQVSDRKLRRRLAPRYRVGCKRILLANDYYPALSRPNVDLVTEPVARATGHGLVTADGVEHRADVIVCSTGFRIEEVFLRTAIRGRDGVELADRWAGGVEAHRGTMVAGFPNLMFLSGPNTGTGSTSQVYMIESQVHYVMQTLRAMRAEHAGAVEVRAQAQAAYNDELQKRMQATVWLSGGCQSWYLDSRGRNITLYPGFSSTFRRSLREFQRHEHILEPARTVQPAADPAPALI